MIFDTESQEVQKVTDDCGIKFMSRASAVTANNHSMVTLVETIEDKEVKIVGFDGDTRKFTVFDTINSQERW